MNYAEIEINEIAKPSRILHLIWLCIIVLSIRNRPHSGIQIIQMSLQLVNNPVARCRANVFHAAIPHLAYLWFWLRLMRAIRSIVCNPLWPSWPARTHLPPGATLVSGPLLTNTLSFIRKEPMLVPWILVRGNVRIIHSRKVKRNKNAARDRSVKNPGTYLLKHVKFFTRCNKFAGHLPA